MFFIDIAVPRDVDPELNKVDGCFVYDIDDLQQVAISNLASRSKEAVAAEAIVSAITSACIPSMPCLLFARSSSRQKRFARPSSHDPWQNSAASPLRSRTPLKR